MEVFELRSRDRSLIISSQMETGEWHKKLGDGAIADAILDRAVSNSYHIFIHGESLRIKMAQQQPTSPVQKNAICLVQVIAFVWSYGNAICN